MRSGTAGSLSNLPWCWETGERNEGNALFSSPQVPGCFSVFFSIPRESKALNSRHIDVHNATILGQPPFVS